MTTCYNPSMIKKWKQLSSKLIFEHPRIKLFEDQVELPDGEQSSYLHFGSGYGAASVVVIKENKILLQKEYSYPTNEIMWQLPGGGINQNEDPILGAERELAEEVGLKGNLEFVGSYYSNNRRSSAKMHLFVATDTTEVPTNHDPEEFFEHEWLTLSQIDKMVSSGEIQNVHLLAALTLVRNKLLALQI